MQDDELKRVLLRLVALADRMEQRDTQVIQHLAQRASELQRAAHGVSDGGQQFARNALDVLRSQGRDAVQAGVDEAVEQCHRKLTETAACASRTSDEVRASATALRRQRNVWLWAAPLALIVGAALAAGGSSYLVWKNMAELKRADFGRDILHATQSGTLTRCGDALCARIGEKPKRYGRKGEYVLLQ